MDTSSTSILIGWKEPADNGCPIWTYEIYRDNGVGDSITNIVDPLIVGNRPSLWEYEISTGLTLQGSTYRFKIWAINDAGYDDSDPLSVILASVPNTPLNGPYSDALITDEFKIQVLVDPLTPL